MKIDPTGGNRLSHKFRYSQSVFRRRQLKPGDQIIAIDGVAVSGGEEAAKILTLKPTGSNVSLTVLRRGKERKVTLTL